jgi:deoxycytidine triphosphate deaminase
MLGEKKLRKLFPDFDEEQYQPNSIDLKIVNVYMSDNMTGPAFHKEEKNVPFLDSQNPRPNGTGQFYYNLRNGNSFVLELDSIKMPVGYTGLIVSRSSLFRSSVELTGGLVDSGFEGSLYVNITNHHRNNLQLEKGTRVAQLLVFKVDGAGVYDGDYQEKDDKKTLEEPDKKTLDETEESSSKTKTKTKTKSKSKTKKK